MYDYLKNLLPRVKQYSRDLDVKELFTDKHWVLVDDEGKRATYVFEHDGNLIVSLSGQPKVGMWKYVSASKSLYLKLDENNSAFLEFNFFNDALFILKKDDDAETPWVLINKNVIPDLNVKNYLNSLLPEGERPDLDVKLELKDGIILSVFGVKTVQSNYEGFKVSNGENPVSDGIYELKNEEKFIEIENSSIKNYLDKTSFKTKQGELILYIRFPNFPIVGENAIFNGNSNITGEFELLPNKQTIKIIKIKDGQIVKIIMGPDWVFIIMWVIILFIILAIFIYSMLVANK